MKGPIIKLPPFPETNPELLEQWDYEKNVGIDPYSLSAGSSQKFSWKCAKNPLHKWDAVLCNRTRKGRDCPYCAGQLTIPEESFAALRPTLMSEWHPTKNEGIDPWILGIGSQTKVWWRCSERHEWSTMVKSRTKEDNGCPECTGRVASEKNSLATVYPDVAAEWHPTRNDKTPRDVTSKNHYRAWWRCRTCFYEWQAPVNMRTVNKSGCPLCGHDEGALKSKKTRTEKEDRELPNYDYETDDKVIANAEALRHMLSTQIKTKTDLKPIESLLSPRLLTRIDYQPYYQRNYVWDKDKATYFIESVLIGTEVPPLIFYETPEGFEVIDGRQRFQTLLRFQGNQLLLSPKGLTLRKDLAHKRFDELSQIDKNFFFDAKLRLIRFSVVNPDRVNEHTQDMLKKEIFRRYNSGITPLRQVDIEKAVYITDDPTQHLKRQFQRNKFLYGSFVNLFLGITAETQSHDTNLMEKALQEARFLLVCAQMPLLWTRKKDTLQQFYEWFSESVTDVQALFKAFSKRVDYTKQLSASFVDHGIEPTKLWNEVVYWALAVMEREKRPMTDLLTEETKEELLDLYKSNEKAYAPAETQFFYSQFLTRYSTMASFLENTFGLSLGAYLRMRMTTVGNINEKDSNEDLVSFTRIEKQDPTSLSIEDLCRDILKNRYLLRPAYQRNEVINRTKSSGIIESILLGIELPPLYAFRRTDGICEIIDGQQRILSIIGYLGSPFLNEKGEQLFSEKNKFTLSNLRILDLTGKTFEELDQALQNRILDYNLSVIVIDEKFNAGFNQVDLFVRLNSRPYPIKENTFEMWNSYVDKDLVDSLKQITSKFSPWFYITRDNLRMRNEELIAILMYLAHTQLVQATAQKPVEGVVDVFRRGGYINVRVKQKAAVTRLMDAATVSSEAKGEVVEAVKKTDAFIRKIRTVLIDEDITDEDSFLDTRLTKLFNVGKKRAYARRYHDFYALWYLLFDLIPEIAIRRRAELRDDLNALLASMKSGSKEDEIDTSPFLASVSAFKAKYAVAERKLRLSRTQKNELIKRQENKCPLCNTPIYIADEIEVDHVIPIAAQGPDENHNLQVVHTLCNRKKRTGM